MPNNRNTPFVIEQPDIDADDWEIALQPYGDDPDRAMILGVCLMVLKGHIEDKPRKLDAAIGEIDRALEALYLHSHFHDASYLLFRRMAQGRLSVEEQNMLNSLGVKL